EGKMATPRAIVETIAGLVREGFVHEFGRPQVEIKEVPVWKEVSNAGSRLWLDTGDIEEASRLWSSEFEALTTNNTLLNKEVQKGIYDDFIPKVASAIRKIVPEIDERELVLEVAFALNAYHGLRLVEKFDAHVSVELHTDLAHDVDRTVKYGSRFYEICPDRFYVKVPLSPAGFLAARKLGQHGVPINFTLGFSARHNYVAALLSHPRYVNVFLGRLNSFVADSNLGDGKNVGEKATLSTQREILKLRDAGRTETRLIGASMREGSQVASLTGVDVLTMPTKVAAEFQGNPVKEISAQVEKDHPVRLAQGVRLDDFNGKTLWEVPDAFKSCVEDLLKEDVDALTPEDLQAHFEDAGFGDFLPLWSDEDRQTVTSDGKIPVYERWREGLSSGKIGMDALMNISALYSFATDQKALDDRVKSLI
ncbi:MAG: transaldolase family protein, partial [Deltaproteobacteria bacterium]|nr:transaldolase family protein [Deltaproteobacteria bacterium]